jgi:hypothetical protein
LILGSLLKWLFDISPRETSFAERGFRGGTPEARARLEQVGKAFVHGYRAALEDSRPAAVASLLQGERRAPARRESVNVPRAGQEPGAPVTVADFSTRGSGSAHSLPAEFLGFSYEGAAMGLALLDWLTPWNRHRVADFLNGVGDPHAYMVHVGAGWVLARVPGSVDKFMARFDPLLRWLIVDGYGFHEAFFRWPRYLAGEPIPKRLQGYARRVFDQGFGRCLWFVEGAEVNRIAQTIASFPSERQSDLWSGVGLACVYAGAVSEAELRSLREAAGPFLPQLAQGAAFAAKARQRAGNLTPYQDLACSVLCGMSPSQAAQVTDEALENLPFNGPEPGYEVWRRRIQQRFLQEQEVVR